MLWLTDWTVFRQAMGLPYKVVFQEADTFSWLSWHVAVWAVNRGNHPPNMLWPSAFFFERHDCFLTRVCALNCLCILRNFLYRVWKHNNAEMKDSFRINDGDRTEVTSMLKCHYLKIFFSTYCVSERAHGSHPLSCLWANNRAKKCGLQ